MAPGPERRRAHAGASGDSAEDLGHERCGLLVADQHVADRRAGKGIGEVDVLLAGDAEHAGDALVLEATHEEVSDSSLLASHLGRLTGPTLRYGYFLSAEVGEKSRSANRQRPGPADRTGPSTRACAPTRATVTRAR